MTASKQKLERMRRELERANDAYYNSGKVVMSDGDYDELKERYLEAGGVPLGVGAPPSNGARTVSVEHRYADLVGTLSKVNSVAELRAWAHGLVAEAGVSADDVEVGLSLKYDGNSVVVAYRDGVPELALTRGRDGKGVDLTDVFRDERIPLEGEVGVKYEVVMTYADFDRLNEDLGADYANPRNIVAGKLGSSDAPRYRGYLTLVPLALDRPGPERIPREEQLDVICNLLPAEKDVNFTERYWLFEGSLDQVVDAVKSVYGEYSETRFDLPFMIDGLVVEFLGEPFESMPIVGGIPINKIALKFPYMQEETRVAGMRFDVGKTGRVTGVCEYEPVEFNGAVQRFTSLANYKRYRELNLGVGSRILVSYREALRFASETARLNFSNCWDTLKPPVPKTVTIRWMDNGRSAAKPPCGGTFND